MAFDSEAIAFLLKASSRDQVVKLCQEAFLYRDKTVTRIPEHVLLNAANVLSINKAQSAQMLHSLGALLKAAVFQGSADPQAVAALFPDGFHKNLRDLLTKIVVENLSAWRAQAIGGQVSLPKLVDFDWRVDIKTSSDTVARMSVPTCLLHLQVQESATEVGKMSEMSRVNVELSKETLDTMLDGLTKIREQLSSVASR